MSSSRVLPVFTFKGHRDSVNALACEDARHANTLASGSDDGTCRLWDIRTTRSTRCMNVQRALGLSAEEAEDAAVNSVVFGNDAYNIHVAASNKVLTFDLRQEGLVLATASKPVLQSNDQEINQLSRHPSKQGTYLSAPDDEGDIRIYDLSTHRLYKTLRGQHSNICSAAPFRPNAPWDLVSGGLDGVILFWDFSRGRVKFKLDLNAGVESAATEESSTSNRMFNPPLVHSLTFAPNGKSFVAGLGDGTITLVDFTSRRIVRRLQHHRAIVSQVHFPAFRSSDWLVSSGNDSQICVWNYSQALTSTRESADSSEQDDPDLVKAFTVRGKPNAITTSLHQNLLHVADLGRDIAVYPLQ